MKTPNLHQPSPDRAISIIIPLYNGADLTCRCLDSLSAHAAPHHRLILVDNASSDATAHLLDSLPPSTTVIRNAANLGFARACNQGAWAATTPYLLFLNNDTVVTPGWLEAMLEACGPDTGVVGCRMLYPDGNIQHAGIELINGIPDHPYRHQPSDLPAANILRDLDMVTGACLLIRRDLFLQLGGFDEVYRNGVEDVDLCLRVREAGFRAVYQPKAMIYHHEGQSSGRFDHVDHNLRFFINRWKGRFDEKDRFIAANSPLIMTAEKSYINEQRLQIIWQGSQFVYHSLALVNRELCQRLIKIGHELSIVPYEPDDFVPEPDSPLEVVQECVNKPLSKPVDTVIRHMWPPDFTPPSAGHWVMIQPWEFGSLPRSWIAPMNEGVDEIWVPSGYVRDCYIQSGVRDDKVYVVPNGVDTELHSPAGITYPIASGKPFRFLFVGGTIHRKGIDLLLAAYRQSFSAQDDVCLVIKDMGGKSFYHGQTAQEMIQRFSADPAAPEIVYLDSSLTQDEMAALYRSCHCLVHPYRGEGFGLPIAEAMASGLPVIVTGYGAALDFCPPDIAWLVPAQKMQFATCRVGDLDTVDHPWLAEPDLNVLAKHMLYAFNHPEEARRRGRAACEHIRCNFTWDDASRCVDARLQELRQKPVVRFSKSTITPSVFEKADKPSDDGVKRRDLAVRAMGQARLLQQRGESETAISLLIQQGIGVTPAWPEPYLALAELLIEEQRFADALQVMLEIPPESERMPRDELEAICHAALGNDDAARESAIKAQERPRGLVVLGTLAARQGELTEAERLFRIAIATDPSCGGALLSLGMLLWSQGKHADAWQSVTRSVAAEPLNRQAVCVLMDMAERIEHLPEAEKLIGDVAQAYPDSRNLSQAHAELLASSGFVSKALDVCESFLVKFGVDDSLLRLAVNLRKHVGLYDRLSEGDAETVSLCMIVKNEEINLPRCLASMKPVVHEMVVVDTGSNDRTRDIAVAFGSKVHDITWTGNFSVARNLSLAQASGSWVLAMDADEVLSPQDYEFVRKAVRAGNGTDICWSVKTRNYTRLHPQGWVANDGCYPREERAEGWHPSHKVRLFPNDPRLRFAGEVHEMIEKSALEAGYQIQEAPFVVHHYGGLTEAKTGDPAKKHAYFELGKKKLAEQPNDLPAIGELAVQAAELELYEEAIALWNRFLQLAPDSIVALFNKGFALMRLERFNEALDVTRRALEIEPFHKEAAFNYGICALYAGDSREAGERLDRVRMAFPAHPPLLSVLTVLFLATGQQIKARKILELLRALNYSISDFVHDRAAMLLRFDKYELAQTIADGWRALTCNEQLKTDERINHALY